MNAESTLLNKINFKLRRDNEYVRKCRTDSRDYSTLGDYYIVDADRNTVTATHCKLESLAAELGIAH